MLRIQKIKSRNCYTFKQQVPSIECKPQGSAMTLFIWAMLLLAHDVPLPFMRGQVSDLQSLFFAKLKVNPRTTLTGSFTWQIVTLVSLRCLSLSKASVTNAARPPWAPFAGLLLQTRGKLSSESIKVINLSTLFSCWRRQNSHTFHFNLNLEAHLVKPNSQSSPDIHVALHWCWRIASCALVASNIQVRGTKDDYFFIFLIANPTSKTCLVLPLPEQFWQSPGPTERNKGLGVCPKVWNFLRFSILPALAIPYQLSSSSCKWSHSPGSEAPAQSPPAVPEANNWGNVVKGCSSSDSVFEGNVFSVWFCVFMYVCCLRAEA